MLPLLRHLRFGLPNAFLATATLLAAAGGPWLWGIFAALPGYCILDEMFGRDRETPEYRQTWLLNFILLVTLPQLGLLYFVFMHHLGSGDPLGFIAGLKAVTGYDFAVAKERTGAFDIIGGVLGLAVFLGSAGVNVAHELLHRTHSPRDRLVARWMLAFSLDTTWPIYHLRCHHRLVATEADPITSRRGEHVAPYIVRAIIGTNRFAFEHEAQRLRGKGQTPWSLQNRALRGQLMSLTLAAACYAIAGWPGVIAFALIGLHGKAYLEAISYIEHYGLIRVPGTEIAARHSWDCHHRLSAVFLFNLPRHADHHRHGHKPFWEVEARDDAPLMPFGYGTMILIAFVPPLWRRATRPALERWDRELASAGELDLLASQRQNAPAN